MSMRRLQAQPELHPGQAVLSLAGRDAGKLMVVLEAAEGFALVADGKRRRLAAPKRKRIKHLRPIGPILEPAAVTTDRQLRKALFALTEKHWETDQQQAAADSSRRV